MVLAFFRRGVEHEVARNLAAGTNEAHNVGVEGQLALQVHLLLEQLQSLCVQPCIATQDPLTTVQKNSAELTTDHGRLANRLAASCITRQETCFAQQLIRVVKVHFPQMSCWSQTD